MYLNEEQRQRAIAVLKATRDSLATKVMNQFPETVDDGLRPLDTAKADRMREGMQPDAESFRVLDELIKTLEVEQGSIAWG